MFVIDVMLKNKTISSAFMTQLHDVQKFAMEWSRNKHSFIGYKVPFGDFNVFVYDVSNPCTSDHVQKPTFIYY